MYSATFTRQKLQSAVFKYLCDIEYNTEQVTFVGPSSATSYEIGTVVGQASVGALTATKTDVSGASKGAITLDATTPVAAGSKTGRYSIVAISSYNSSGPVAAVFEVVDPSGISLGSFSAGATFNNGIKFVKASGTTDAVGDVAYIDVAAAAGTAKFAPLNLSATDGTQNAAGVLFMPLKMLATTDASGVAVTRGPAVVVTDGLEWPSGITDTQKATALAQLKALGIVSRSI